MSFDVLMNRPVSSALSEKAMAWITKSRLPHSRAERREAGVELVLVRHVDVDQKRRPAQRLGKRPDPFAEGFALVAEGELRAFRVKRLRDAPGDGVVVRDPHHEAALAGQELRHPRSPVVFRQRERRVGAPEAEAVRDHRVEVGGPRLGHDFLGAQRGVEFAHVDRRRDDSRPASSGSSRSPRGRPPRPARGRSSTSSR